MDYLGFSIHRTTSSTNRDSFISFFAIWMLIISFSCIIALVRISSTILNSSDESGHPCLLVPDLRGRSFSLSPLNMVLAVGFS